MELDQAISEKTICKMLYLKSEYHASDPLHACVYILCLHSAVSDEYTFITNILHKKRNISQDIMINLV